ncbi:helix-turn-helix transcriptional regulator [Chromobacterium vaccinii]|uniref:helix-turn-helix transcriptional regulator n=1 Tax=Chromobacterium vaccinii TaxID=1108595 RepID=UPI0009E5D49D|nr:LuxR C-terminal-related transcriptional regulator [Chromobacterium vaccinii]
MSDLPDLIKTQIDSSRHSCGVKNKTHQFLYAHSQYLSVVGASCLEEILGRHTYDLPINSVSEGHDYDAEDGIVLREERPVISLHCFRNGSIYNEITYIKEPLYSSSNKLEWVYFRTLNYLKVDTSNKLDEGKQGSESSREKILKCLSNLTDKEFKILELFCAGKQPKEIAFATNTSVSTISKALARIKSSLNISNNFDIIRTMNANNMQPFLHSRASDNFGVVYMDIMRLP